MVPQLESAGLMFVGKDETGERMEVVELQENPSGHPFYAAAQVCYTTCFLLYGGVTI
jgi:CTP synthase